MTPLTVGLAGAGPWGARVYAPMLAAGPETRLAAVWSRTAESARALARRHGVEAVGSFDALLARCEAVAFAVPPDVQAELGVAAARAGKHLMLDKPLALDLAGAQRLERAVEASGVVTQLMLTHRFRPATRAFLDRARGFDAFGARLAFLSSAFLRGPYANAWRREQGALHDLGPHAFDLLEGALGPIERLAATGDPRRWITVSCVHAGGAVSDLALTGIAPLERSVFRLDLYGPAGGLSFDAVAASGDEPWPLVRSAFAEAVRSGRPVEPDIRRGVRIQELIERALRSL